MLNFNMYNKFDDCYEKSKEIGFVQSTGKTDIYGKEIYNKCPGEERHPGILDARCFKCPYFKRSRNKS